MEPQTYVASAASTDEAIKVVPKAPISRIEGDPLKSFEVYHFTVATDLRLWLTFSVEDRIERLRQYEDMTPRKAEDLRLDHERVHKILNYVIWLESIDPRGKREVAALAFNMLFPRKANG